MRNFIYLLAATLCTLSVNAQKMDQRLLIGTYTAQGKSEGIYVYDFNTATAEMKQVSVQKNVINPSWLTLTADKEYVYAVNEDADKSEVSAFGYDAAAGKLSFLNKQSAQGADPCYVIADDKHVMIANYSGGSIAVFQREAAGKLSAAKQVIQHTGSGINKERQESAHVHMVRFSPDGKYVVCNDLGEDKVYLYAYHHDAVKDVLEFRDSVSVKAGSGPRHITFSKDGKYAYLIQELEGDVTAFSYNKGKLKIIQQTSLVDQNFKGENGGADIQLSADGKFLYLSNRGTENNITTFAVGNDGKLTKKGQVNTGGEGPRAFVIDPSGKWLLVGHQNSNNIVVFSRNQTTGELTNTGKKVAIGAPVCFVFAPKK